MRLTYAHVETRWWAAAGAVGLALALQWAIIFGYRFDGLYGQDAFAYYDYGLQVWESARRFMLPPPLYWLVRYGAGWRLRWLVLAAFALAWALMTRWIYGLLVAPFGVYWFLDLRSHMADRRSPIADQRRDKQTSRQADSTNSDLPVSSSPG